MSGWRMGRSRRGSASMPYELAFHPEALREWRTLTTGIREQFKKKFEESTDPNPNNYFADQTQSQLRLLFVI